MGSMDANRRAALVGTARSLFIFLINNSERARSSVLKSPPSTRPCSASTINEWALSHSSFIDCATSLIKSVMNSRPSSSTTPRTTLINAPL